MSDQHDYGDTAAFLTSTDTLEATVEYDGDEYPIEFRDISIDELQRLEDLDESGDMSDAEFVGYVFDEYLIAPDLGGEDVGETSLSRAMAVLATMMREWQQADEIEAAMDEVDVEGNRRRR